jgi:nucleoside-diphosphate-sugar epimerase
MTTPDASDQAPPQTALVTGATGFIGGHLVRHLARLGWKVHALARQVSTDPDIALAATWHSYDGDYESVSRAVASSEPDVVFHLASLFLSEHKPEQIDALVNANLRFGMHLLEAMYQHNVRRLINTGTSWQHYNNADYDPVNLYAATKQAFEAIIDYYCNAHQFSAITLKLFDTYGPGDLRQKLIPYLAQSIDSGESLKLSDGLQIISLVHIYDVVDGFHHASSLLAIGKHERFGLAHPEHLSIRDIVSRLVTTGKWRPKVIWGAKAIAARQMSSPPQLSQMPAWRAGRSFPNEWL